MSAGKMVDMMVGQKDDWMADAWVEMRAAQWDSCVVGKKVVIKEFELAGAKAGRKAGESGVSVVGVLAASLVVGWAV